MSKTRIGKLYRGLIGSRAGQPKPRPEADLDPAERSFRHIWRYVKFTSGVDYPPERKRPNLLVLQMGKVASLAIQNALYHGGVNAFHCHELSLARQQATIANLLQSELTYGLASHELRLHIHNASLAMLVRWYQQNKRYRGRKIKVVTLTRDPVSHYKSWFIQRLHVALPKVCGWQRARMGAAVDAAVDQPQAVQDIVLEAASIIVAAGASDRAACEALARERWPLHPVVMEEVWHWLRPLTWFDTEILDLFGLDALAGPELRERGWIVMENDWAEILALRFEQLGALVPKIAEFAGLQSLTLRERNVTERKAGAAQFLAAMQAAIDTPTGQACVEALRASPYARACRYDQPAL
jgi:hypothetical protein